MQIMCDEKMVNVAPTWKCRIIVHIRPSVSFGLPSTMSSARILTSLIFLYRRKSNAIWAFCSIWNRIFPFSLGCRTKIQKLITGLGTRKKPYEYLQGVRQKVLPKAKEGCVHLADLQIGRRLCVTPKIKLMENHALIFVP